MSALNILIADDHRLVAHGLRKILEEQTNWHVVAEVTDGRDAVRLAADLRPDVAVVDLMMPQLNGIEATVQIAQRAPTTRVLVLSMHSDEGLVGRALQAGAKGYLLKDSLDTELVRAVAAIASGEAFFSPAIVSRLVDDYVSQLAGVAPRDPLQKLSPREREVFQLVIEGHTNRQIAVILGVKPATVESHRAHLLEKLSVHSTAELVRFAAQRGIIK
jgi:two-component system response regulator NreC